MLRILVFLGLTVMACANTAYAQTGSSEPQKFVCKDSVDPRCMTE